MIIEVLKMVTNINIFKVSYRIRKFQYRDNTNTKCLNYIYSTKYILL